VSRILTIATIHDILTENKGHIETVNALSMIRQLTSALEHFIPEDKRIVFEVSGDNVVIGSNQASAVALVVNELVINALEHAFPDRDGGRVTVTLGAGNSYHIVTVSDNGVGFNPKPHAEDGLGLRIAESTVRGKLQGKLHIHSDECGTVVSFDIKNEMT